MVSHTLGHRAAPRGRRTRSRRSDHRVARTLGVAALWLVGILVVLFVAIWVLLDPLATHLTRKGLDALEGYEGTFSDVSVGLFPPRYAVTDLELIQDGTDPKEPFAYARKIVARLSLGKLFAGRLVGVASIQEPKFYVEFGVTEPPAAEGAAPEAPEKETSPFNLQAALGEVIPLRLERLEMREGELVLIDATVARRPRLWIHGIELAIDNLVTRERLDRGVPQLLTLRAQMEDTGVFEALISANLIEDRQPAVTGQAQLTGLQLASLHGWTAARAGVSARGTFQAFANFSSNEGKVSGAVKVLVEHPELKPASDELDDTLKAAIGDMALSVLSDRVAGREAVGTTLPIKGTLETPNPQIWPAIIGVLRNAFVDALSWGFDELPPPTAEHPQSPIEQTVEGLDEDEPGPRAQPRE